MNKNIEKKDSKNVFTQNLKLSKLYHILSKKLVLVTGILIVCLICSLSFLYKYKKNIYSSIYEFNIWTDSFLSKNTDEIFKIDSITLFSSCNALNTANSSNHFTIENLYQYIDIAVFIEPSSSTLTAENTYKSLTITDFNVSAPTEIGTHFIAFKSINDFSKAIYPTNHLLSSNSDSLNFEISNLDNVDLSTPILYNNYANPITLSFINSNIVTDYTFTDTTSPITYDGTLLNRCNISAGDLILDFSFCVNIENNLGQKFKTTLFFNTSSLISELMETGYSTSTLDTTSIFYRYE